MTRHHRPASPGAGFLGIGLAFTGVAVGGSQPYLLRPGLALAILGLAAVVRGRREARR